MTITFRMGYALLCNTAARAATPNRARIQPKSADHDATAQRVGQGRGTPEPANPPIGWPESILTYMFVSNKWFTHCIPHGSAPFRMYANADAAAVAA